MLYAVKPSLLFVTETWLNENVPTGCLDPESHYYVMRCDSKSGRGEGVCAFVHKSLCPVEIHVAANYKDNFCVLICHAALRNCVFFCVYRPSNNDDNARVYLDLLLTCLKEYTLKGHTNVIVGDLNYPDIDWFT